MTYQKAPPITAPGDVAPDEEILWLHPEMGWMHCRVVRVNRSTVTIIGDDGVTRRESHMGKLRKRLVAADEAAKRE